MNQSTKTILTLLEQYLEENPSVRFMQALHNLNINQFADAKNPETKEYLLRDSYNDKDDDVLARITVS